MMFVNLDKAYDSVPRKQLWEAIKKITQRLHKIKAQIKMSNELKKKKTIAAIKGLKQGCGLSPF